MFRGPFRMAAQCATCQAVFDREPGFYLGAIYFNYGLTALIVTVSYLVLRFGLRMDGQYVLTGLLAFVVLFPLWFFRYARSLWLGFDEFMDPSR